MKSERRQKGKPLPPASIDLIPIRIIDRSQYIHYPASPDDIRGLLRILPASLTDGLKAIELCLGKQYKTRPRKIFDFESDYSADPYTGRIGQEFLSGVYMGKWFGLYFPQIFTIRLSAFVYSFQLPHRHIVEFYLRLKMLMTFIHELGHHFDNISRVARGRWRMDNTEKAEIFAEDVQHNWAQEYIVPYLEKTYKKEVVELRTWMLKHAGVIIPLTFLAGDPRGTGPGGTIRTNSLFDTAGAFEDFVSAVIQNQDPTKARIEFARDIHYSDEYKIPLAILKTVLEKDPVNIEAIILESDIFIHQEKFELALNLPCESNLKMWTLWNY